MLYEKNNIHKPPGERGAAARSIIVGRTQHNVDL